MNCRIPSESKIILTEGELKVGRMIMDDLQIGKYCVGQTYIGHRLGITKAHKLGKEMFKAQVRNSEPDTAEPFVLSTENDRQFLFRAVTTALPYYEELPGHSDATADRERRASFQEWISVMRGLSQALAPHE